MPQLGQTNLYHVPLSDQGRQQKLNEEFNYKTTNSHTMYHYVVLDRVANLTSDLDH